MAVVGIALLLFSVISGNYLFALIVVLFGIILFCRIVATGRGSFAITEAGIVVGNNYYPFKEVTQLLDYIQPSEVKIFISQRIVF